jgi:hypothetical protein
VVNSTELDTPGRKLGIEHYRYQLTLRKTYDHITTNFSEDQQKNVPKDALPPLSSPLSDDDDEDENNNEDDTKPEGMPHRHTKSEQDHTDITTLPKPLANRLDYLECIYKATTTNPAVFLAILRIAERNFPFIDFDSALTHLPNLPPNSHLPPLASLLTHPPKKDGQPLFIEDTPYQERKDDEAMTILFLPRFYKDGRHAVGYYALAPERDAEKKVLGVEDVVQVLFTPCEVRDLVGGGLVKWVPVEPGKVADKEEVLDVEYMECVGARGGEWLERDVVEDWDEWSQGFRVARRVWERIIRDLVSPVLKPEPEG